MYHFGLIKDEGVWNTPSTDIYFQHSFPGYKPSQSCDVFGLISSTDKNFWILSEDDDHYWTVAKISEKILRNLLKNLQNNDFSDESLFSLSGEILTITLFDLQKNKNAFLNFHISWVPSLIKTLDIDHPIFTEKEILPVWEKSIIPDRILYPLMSPDEYVFSCIEAYPSLYASPDFEISKFKVYDRLFNSLSSNSDFEEFQEELFKKRDIDTNLVKRLCNEISYDGFLEVDIIDLGIRKLKSPRFHTCCVRNVFKEDQNKYPEVVYWNANNPKRSLSECVPKNKSILISTKFRPYPNFNKKYSVLWIVPEILKLFNNEWKQEIKWFYQQCFIAIEEGCFKEYNQFPTGVRDIDLKTIKKHQDFNCNYTNDVISKNYGIEFSGDWEELLSKQWIIRKQEYLSFIKETLNLLN